MTVPARRTNVLDGITPLVGRADALLALEQWVTEGRRLITLIGAPGAGKSRLALAFAAALEPSRYPGGIGHCDLEECRTADAIRSRVQAAVTEAGGAVASLEDAAGLPPAFLVLDNIEAAIPELAPLLETWLRSNAALTCITTSRQRVGLLFETTFVVGPLEEEAAIALFQERCAAARGGLVGSDPLVVRAIVRRLDCMPLALELAAEHARALDLTELLARLEPTLPFLSSTLRTRTRTRCLRAALASSAADLMGVERSAWLALARFRGEFDLLDAESAFSDPGLPTAVVLTRLSERSLVRADSVNGRTTYCMLRVTREYAAELSSAEPGAEAPRDRFDAALLHRARASLDREGDLAVLAWLCRHAETLVAAARSALEAAAVERALELLVAVSYAAVFQGPIEPPLALLEGLELEKTPNIALRCRALHARGRLRARNGRPSAAVVDLGAAHAALNGASATAELRVSLAVEIGNHHRHQGDWQRARSYYEEALDACSSEENGTLRARVLAALAGMAHERGELERSREIFERALAAARTHALPLLEATIQQNLGLLLLELGERGEGAACFRRAIEAHRALGHRRFEGIAEYDLACLALEEDAVGEARAGFERALQLASEVGDRREVGLTMALLAVCDALTHDVERAARAVEEAERVLRPLGQPALALALNIHRGHVELAAAMQDLETGDAPARDAKLASVRARISCARATMGVNVADEKRASGPHTSSDEARYALRVLVSAYARHSALDEYALVDHDGRWFQPAGGQRVDLRHRVPLQRLLSALVRNRMHAPNQPLPVDELIRAGWPGEKAVTKASKNRLHVAINTLRKSGLDPHLVHSGGGYHLARALPWRTARDYVGERSGAR